MGKEREYGKIKVDDNLHIDKLTLWKSATLVLALLLLASIITGGFNFNVTANIVAQNTGSADIVEQQPVAGLDEFAKCLTENGATMYGASWCPHCQNQKAMFGSSFQYVNYVECADNPQPCSAMGVEGYPTWIVNGKQYPGEQSLDSLGSITGCKMG